MPLIFGAVLLIISTFLGGTYLVNSKFNFLPQTIKETLVSNSTTPSTKRALDKTILWSLIQSYRVKNNFPVFEEKEELCGFANKRLTEIKSNWSPNFLNEQELLDYGAGVNESRDNSDENWVMNVWTTTGSTVGNLSGNYKYACLVAEGNYSVLIVASSIKTTPTNKPVSLPKKTIPVVIPKIETDPIISCSMHADCGGGSRQLKQSACNNMICCNFGSNCGGPKFVTRAECNNSVCCQIGNNWSVYPSNDACDKAQSNSVSSNNSAANYPPCTVYYPALNTSSTYSYTSPETCKQWQDLAKAGSTNTYQVAQQPTAPAQDNTEYNNLLKQHQEACKGVVAEWNTYKENYYANEYNNYSSSAEAVQELERRRQAYQQEAYSVGCTQTISLY